MSARISTGFLSLGLLLAPLHAGGSEDLLRPTLPSTGPEIAEQGNRALRQIRREFTLQAPVLAAMNRAAPVA